MIKIRTLKNISGYFTLILFFAVTVNAQNSEQSIRVNQVGYYKNSAKKAAVINGKAGSVFYLQNSAGVNVFEGKLGTEIRSANSKITTSIADFSVFQQEGTFQLLIPEISKSFPFRIAENVNHEAIKAALKIYYYQRVSEPLLKEHAGKWARPAGHADDIVFIHSSAVSEKRPEGTIVSGKGGWYDAGDYNKYVVNSGITMGTLLAAYEEFPYYFDTLNLNIPESSDSIPDLLNEVLVNLRWMLTMQDPYDGGVYHKLTNADFDGFVMPGVTKEKRYMVKKSTAAALDFAAVMAQSYRVYKQFNTYYPGLADSCIKAAENAWKWARNNPNKIYDQQANNAKFLPAITTGAYGDRILTDEWFWAATELLISTGKKEYSDTVNKGLKTEFSLQSWANVSMMGLYSLIRHKENIAREIQDTLTLHGVKSLITLANNYINYLPKSAFATVMGQSVKDFVWGSNGLAANQGMLLYYAFKVSDYNGYIQAAATNADYILGRNATGYCFLSGFGSKPIMHPHHRPSIADGITDPVPGILSGGPNPGRQDKCDYEFFEPETSFTDHNCSYASNEFAINWNAPLVFLLAVLEVKNN